jgi:hypothetical protein
LRKVLKDQVLRNALEDELFNVDHYTGFMKEGPTRGLVLEDLLQGLFKVGSL